MGTLFDFAFLPSEPLGEHDCRIVIDQFRASSQITTFFDCGGQLLLPVAEVDEAFSLKAALGGDWRLMGERGGLAPDGFDFGNSPTELYSAGAPKNAIITTSNGTAAILKASGGCANVQIACARNATEAAARALAYSDRIGIVAAGRNGEFSFEDTIVAGLVIDRLLSLAPQFGAEQMELTDGAIAALDVWEKYGGDLLGFCYQTKHGRILGELGFQKDMEFCCEIDASENVPYLTNYEKYLALTV